MKKKTTKQQPVTQDHLHKALSEQSKVIVGAFGSKITEIKSQVGLVNTDIKEIKKQLKETNARVDKTYNLIDRYLKAQEDFIQEFSILKAEIAKIKKVIKDKLGIEIRAL